MNICMHKVLKQFLVVILIQFLVVSMSSAKAEEVKDCFEKINRTTFAFNMALDKILFKPISKGYRYLPSPIRSGTSNALNNLSNVVTIPNNILQGQFVEAGIAAVMGAAQVATIARQKFESPSNSISSVDTGGGAGGGGDGSNSNFR